MHVQGSPGRRYYSDILCARECEAVCVMSLLLPDAAPVGEVNNLQGFSPLNEIGQVKVDNVVADDDVRV